MVHNRDKQCIKKVGDNMSFTIKCDKCGNEHILESGAINREEIDFIVLTDREGTTVVEIGIYCENKKCNNFIDIDY